MATRKQKQLSKSFRMENWSRHVGIERGTAQCFTGCGAVINAFQFVCGHIIAQAHGGVNSHTNVVPICEECNSSMGTERMDEYCARNGFIPRANIESALAEAVDAVPMLHEEPFDTAAMNIIDILHRYKVNTLLRLDDTLERYKKFAEQGTHSAQTREFHAGIIDRFLENLCCNGRFGATNTDGWGELGSGERVLARILLYIKENGFNIIKPKSTQREVIAGLDRLLIKFISTEIRRTTH